MGRATDRHGYPLSTSSPAAEQAYREGVERLLSGLPAIPSFRTAIASDPSFALARLGLSISLQEAGDAAGAEEARREAIDLSRKASEREQAHVGLAARISRGEEAALPEIGGHLGQFPKDEVLLDQALRHVFFFGGAGKRRRALDLLQGVERHFGNDWYFLSRQAFHLQELGEMESARDAAERSLSLNPRNANAMHALIHVDQHTGRGDLAAPDLQRWVEGYDPGGRLYGHLWWHRVLIELDAGRDESARMLQPKVSESGGTGFLSLADEASLDWRFRLYGGSEGSEPVGSSLRPLAERYAAKPGRAFIDVHVGMAFILLEDHPALSRLVETLGPESLSAQLVSGLEAFASGRWERAMELLAVPDDRLEAVGGSNIERALFLETLAEASLRAGRLTQAREVIQSLRSTPRWRKSEARLEPR